MTGRSHHPFGLWQRGFTLLELLVVMFIIVTLSTLVMLSLPKEGRQQGLKREAQRLAVLVKMARDEALLLQRNIGLKADAHGYRFLLMKAGQWSAEELDQGVFRARALPDGMSLKLDPEGQKGTQTGDAAPQVVFWSSAEVTPFRGEFQARDTESQALSVDALGQITWQGDDG